MTAGLFGTGHHWYWTGQTVVSMALSATFSAMEVVPLILPLFVFSRIFSKAGYSGLLSLLLYIPLVNVIVLVYFAYTEWPIEKQLKERKQ
jgi:hypothetical protein